MYTFLNIKWCPFALQYHSISVLFYQGVCSPCRVCHIVLYVLAPTRTAALHSSSLASSSFWFFLAVWTVRRGSSLPLCVLGKTVLNLSAPKLCLRLQTYAFTRAVFTRQCAHSHWRPLFSHEVLNVGEYRARNSSQCEQAFSWSEQKWMLLVLMTFSGENYYVDHTSKNYNLWFRMTASTPLWCLTYGDAHSPQTLDSSALCCDKSQPM